jgi:hypothetical protein
MLQKFMPRRLGLFEKLAKYLVAAVIVIVALFPKFPLLSVPGIYVAVRFEDLIVLSLAVVILIKISLNPRKFLTDEIVRAFLIFFAVGFISLLSGAFLTQTVELRIGLLHLLRRVEYVVPFVAAITLFSKDKISEHLNFYIKLLLIVILIAFVYGLGQRYYNFPIIITQNEEYSKGVALFWTPGSHINSTFAGHYDLASVMVIFLSITIPILFVVKDNLSRLALFFASGAGLWLLINSVSRIAQASYLVGVGLSLIFIRKYKALAIFIIVSIAIIASSSGLSSRFGRIFEVFYRSIRVEKVVSIFKPSFVVSAQEVVLPERRPESLVVTPTPTPLFEDRSTSIRLNVEWPRAIRALKKNPLLGTGYSSIDLATDNDYLRMLGETGILGFLAFWLIFFRIGKTLLSAFPLTSKLTGIELGFMAGISGGLVGTFITAFFIDIFEASKFAILFWFLLGYAVFLARNLKYVQNK